MFAKHLLVLALALGLTGFAAAQDEACNDLDSSARAIIEQYLGEDVPDFSLYNTTVEARVAIADELETLLLDMIGGAAGGNIDTSGLTDFIMTYAFSIIGYVLPGVLALLFVLFVGTPVIFVRLCCSRKCCSPHHPLWGAEPGTLKDYPPPKCCGCSRAGSAPAPAKKEGEGNWNNGSPTAESKAQDEGVVRPYTYWEQCSPVFFYILFAALLVAVCISGSLAVGTIVSGVDGTVCAIDKLLDDGISFMDGLAGAMNDMLLTGVEKIDEVVVIVDGAETVSADAAEVAVNGSYAVQGIDDLIAATVSDYQFDSAAVTSALNELNSASTTLDSTLVLVRSNIVGPKETILGIAEQLDGITNQTDGFFAAAKGALHTDEIEIPAIPLITDGTPLSGFVGITELLETNALALGSVFFVLPILSVPFTVFGILVMGPKCAHRPHPNKSKTLWQCCGLLFSRLSCCSLYLTLIPGSIAALLLFPVSVVVTDTCTILERFGDNHSPYIDALLGALGLAGDDSGSESVSNASAGYVFEFDITSGVETAIDTCFTPGGNLLEALNITGTLQSYVQSVDFSAVEAVNPSEIVDIDAITAQIANLTDRADIYSILAPFDAADQATLSAACTDCTDMSGAVSALQRIPFYDGTTDYSAVAAACTSPCASPPSACAELNELICNMTTRISGFEADLNRVKANFTVVSTGLTALYADIEDLHADLTESANDIQAFASEVFELNSFSDCGFIKEFYDATITALCPGSTSGLLWFGYSLNIMALSSICVIVCIILINCRLGGVGQPNHHSSPKNFLPKNLSKFFNGHHDDGPNSSKVAPSSHESTGLELTRVESEDAQKVLDESKKKDDSGQAGVAM